MGKRQQVPIQKGKINPNPMTMKQMTHNARLQERQHELSEIKRMQTLELQTPKQ